MKSTVNLLPPSYRRRQLLRRRAMQWGAVLGVVLLAVVTGRWTESLEYYALNRKLEAASREAHPAAVMLREIKAMRQEIDDVQDYEAIAQELEHRRLILPLLGLVSQAARVSDGKLRLLQLRCEGLQSVTTHETTGNSKANPGTVKLVGVALDSPTVAGFEQSLIESGMFADVKLVKTNEHKAGAHDLCDYELMCEL